MSPSSKFWLGIYTLTTIGLMVLIHPLVLLPIFLFTVIILPFDVLTDIFDLLDEFFTRIFANPVKSFNRWLDSKFGK
jgi:hypothetical protein